MSWKTEVHFWKVSPLLRPLSFHHRRRMRWGVNRGRSLQIKGVAVGTASIFGFHRFSIQWLPGRRSRIEFVHQRWRSTSIGYVEGRAAECASSTVTVSVIDAIGVGIYVFAIRNAISYRQRHWKWDFVLIICMREWICRIDEWIFWSIIVSVCSYIACRRICEWIGRLWRCPWSRGQACSLHWVLLWDRTANRQSFFCRFRLCPVKCVVVFVSRNKWKASEVCENRSNFVDNSRYKCCHRSRVEPVQQLCNPQESSGRTRPLFSVIKLGWCPSFSSAEVCT